MVDLPAHRMRRTGLCMKKNIRHFVLLTTLAAGTVHVINRFIDITADIKNILKSENGNYFDWKNGKIYYTKRGTGSPILLIHSLDPASSSYEWCRMIKKIGKTSHGLYTRLVGMWQIRETIPDLHQLSLCPIDNRIY